MKKIILILLGLTAMAGCGKKQEDPGAQFSVKSLGDFQTLENGALPSPITREDENAGPSYKVDGDLGPIQYFDKKLSCGPVTINARRAIKTDMSFLSFKISEAEFHGLNQLPQHAECILSVTSTNGNGSTVTKNSTVDLRFDSSPSLKIRREYLTVKTNLGLSPSNTIPMEYYEITNPFAYAVGIIYRSTRFITAGGYFPGGVGESGNIYPTLIEFEPSNIEYMGSFEMGYRFKIPTNSTIKIFASGRPSAQWTPMCGSTISGPPLSLTVFSTGEPDQPIVQSSKFEFSSEDFSPGRVLNTKQLTVGPLRGVRPLRPQSSCPTPPMNVGG